MRVAVLGVKCKAKDLLKIIEEQYLINMSYLERWEG